MIEFVCEGCGINVVEIVGRTIPAHGFCSVCAHVNEHVPGPEGLKVLDFISDRRKDGTTVTLEDP